MNELAYIVLDKHILTCSFHFFYQLYKYIFFKKISFTYTLGFKKNICMTLCYDYMQQQRAVCVHDLSAHALMSDRCWMQG